MIKHLLIPVMILAFASGLQAQKIDSINFHLYTDSLKKGQYNYINVDGKMANGKWLPLTENELLFDCAEASFRGNELIIPEDFKPAFVTITVALKTDKSNRISRKIWIKQLPDPPLPTDPEKDLNPRRRNKRN